MIDIILRIVDYGLRFYGQLRKVLDLKIFAPALTIFIIYATYLNNYYLQNPQLLLSTASTQQTAFVWPFGGYIQLITLVLIIGTFFNRKLIVLALNYRTFSTFYDALNNRRLNEQEFREIWSRYENVCKRLGKKHWFIDEGTHYDGIMLVYRRINQKCYTNSVILRRNTNTAAMGDDIKYQEKVMLNSYLKAICEYVIEYNHETHKETGDEDICDKFNQIRLEQEFIEIIKYCHADGYGFLSTLALENLVGISLSLPQDRRVKILEILSSIPVMNIGWLNRRVFEVILISVVFNTMPNSELNQFIEDLKKLDEKISNICPKLIFDERIESIKNEFKEEMRIKYLQKQGFNYVL